METFRCRVCGEVYIGKKNPGSCPFCGAHESYFVLAREWSLIKADKLSEVTQENLKKALDIEINNTNFYQAVSGSTTDLYLQGLFKGLSKVEREHASSICKHLGISKPDSEAGKEALQDSDKENIAEADRREKRAVKFYGEAASAAIETKMKDFFKALIQIEADHITILNQ